MRIIFSPKSLEYTKPWYYESPYRTNNAWEFLNDKYEFIEPEPASERDLLKVYSKEYVKKIKTGKFKDRDSPAFPDIYDYARLAAGGAMLAAKERGFSLMRPPGHHAGTDGLALGAPTLGYCYFNSMAIAVRSLGLQTLIIDIDAHHGNGSQDIFLGDEKVVFISLHKEKIYPWTGLKNELNCFNYPLPSECGDKIYLKTLSDSLKQVDLKNIEIIGISAGFDTRKGDIGSLGLTSGCFSKIGKMINGIGLPVFVVLEGGYGGNLAPLMYQLLQGLESK